MALERTDYTDRARAPDGKREVQYPSPNVSNLVVVESVPISPETYKALPYGTPHPDYAGTGLILVRQRQIKATNNQIWAQRVYASKNINEDWYDYTLRYAGDVVANPIFIRIYHKLRNDFQPLTKGTPFKGVYRMVVTAGGANYTGVPTVVFTGANTTPAAANAIMSPPDANGKMTLIGLELIDEGDGYTAAPAISFTGGGGSGAAATAYIQPAAAILIKEELVELENESPDLASLFVKVTRVYETLPGPFFIWNEYEDEKAGGQRNRGAVKKTSQSIFATGTEVAVFDRPSTGQARKTWFEPRGESAIVLTKFVETWTEILIADKALTGEFGGGMVDVSETRDEPGAQTPDQGLMVIESDTKTVSPDEQIKTTRRVEGSEWPELTGDETDPHYGITIDISKKVVPAGTAYPGVTVSLVSPFVDIQPHDKWRSIQIVSKLRLPLPDPISWGAYHHLDLPSTLLNVTASWDKSGSEEASARLFRGYGVKGGPNKTGAIQVTAAGGTLAAASSPDSGILAEASVTVANGAMGSIEVLFNHGYRGPAKATIERRFYFGPPPFGDLPAVTRIIPVTGSASLLGKHTSFHKSIGTGPTLALGTNGQMQSRSLTFGPFLSGSVVSNQQTFSAAASIADAQAGPDLDGTPGDFSQYEATFILPGAQGLLNVNIPASVPASIASGTQIVVDVIVEEWRFSVFVVYIITATVP
jgi:hypothetical protein